MCYEGNWDGWSKTYEDKIIKHLREKDLEVPERNENGLLPRN
jgi:hypothetical protein